ncbi:amino acid deaminase [Pseudoxanthomonas dokdonensis]|uniref:Amino acid deaminase n=1 Tax=Pseudoxanthomonas dokdonensis TaxID=344882 RepID=A0A0R0CF04_9GAMM|nr:amino acid deaminase [Pseudoxanthomonas dokdonensis]
MTVAEVKNSFRGQSLLSGKGLGADADAFTTADVGAAGWRILDEDVSLPAAVLQASAMQHNLDWMAAFMRAYRVALAPHGKTTMCPALFQRQMQAGAWGITLATAPQVQAAHAHGIGRVLMANQLVGKANMAIIARLLRRPDFEFCCLVDSVDNVEALGRFFAGSGLRLRVLLEIGVAGGRSGVRDDAQAAAVVQALQRWPQALALVGVEVYEGVLKDEAGIRGLLRRTLDRFQALRQAAAFAESPALLSGAGSAWFDVVAEEFAAVAGEDDVQVVLRPGCYLSHDVGAYRQAAQRMQSSNPVARDLGEGLRPALQVWACVQSRPEPERVIVALGKRDAAYDAGLPQPHWHYRPGSDAPVKAAPGWQLTAMMDQHAFLQVDADADIAVGDLLSFDISHPCLTFDKWRHLLVVDDDWQVREALPTCF